MFANLPQEIGMFKAKIIPCFCLLLLFSGCNSSSSKTSSKIVRINLGNEPHTLDPRLARDPNAQTLMRMFFEGLTRIGPNDQPQLALAESLEISQNLKTYTFYLRKANWTNGDPIRASDFVYTWRKILAPDYMADNAYQLYVLKNAKKIKDGELPVEELGVIAEDERTLVVEIENPTPYFLELLAMPFFFPVNPNVDRETSKWAERAETYVCSGPFHLKKWSHHNEIEASKNAHYWDADQVKIDGLSLVMVESDAEIKLFEQKKLHWVGSPLSSISVDAIPTLKQKKTLFIKPRAETAFLRVNTSKFQLQDPKIRKALALSINREGIVEHILQGGQIAAYRLVPPSMQLQKNPYFSESNQRAIDSLEIGLTNQNLTREDLASLTLLYINSERGHLIAQAIQQQWHDAFGVRIQLEAAERKVYFDRISRQDYDLAFCSWGADFHDPINFLEVFKYQNQSTNNTCWENEEYARALDQSFTMTSANERNSLLTKCEQNLMDAMPIIPIFHYTMLYQKDEKLQNVFLSSLGNIDFKWAILENGN